MRNPRTPLVLVIALQLAALTPLLVALPARADVAIMPAALPATTEGAASVWDGTDVYIIGGRDTSCCFYDRIVRYTPANNAVTTLAAKLPEPTYMPSAAWTGSEVLLFGGYGASSAWLASIVRFDPATGEVTTAGATLPSPRQSSSAVWTGTHAFIFGGGNSGGSLGDIVRYDPVADTTTSMGAHLSAARDFSSAVWTGSAAYIFGGRGSAAIDKYDPATDTLTTVASLPSARMGTSASWDGTYAYAFGGFDGSVLRDIVRFDPATNAVTTLPDQLPTARWVTTAASACAAAFISGGAQSTGPSSVLTQILRFNGTPLLPPTTTLSLSGTQGAGGWFRSSVEGTFSVPSCAAATTQFSIDGGAFQEGTSFSLGGEGTHTVQYRSTGSLGLSEDLQTATVNIDTVAPTCSGSYSGTAGTDGWFTSTGSETLTSADATSGVASTTFRLDGGPSQGYVAPFPITGDGIHDVACTVTDVAGNEGTAALTVKLDTTAPATSAALSGTAGTNGWWQSSVDVTLSATDATSGVAATFFSVDGSALAEGTTTTVAGDGTHTLDFFSKDLAGNFEGTHTVTIRIDTTPPDVAMTDPTAGHVYVDDLRVPLVGGLPLTLIVGDKTIRADAFDATSGVARVDFYVDGVLRASDPAAPYEWLWPSSHERLGDHVLQVVGVDVAGNTQAAPPLTVTTIPTTVDGILASLPPVPATGDEPSVRGDGRAGVVASA